MTEKIVLFESRSETLSITIALYFDTSGRLILDGCDMGPWVEQRTGDFDYEYRHTVEKEGVAKLYALFNLDHSNRYALLDVLKERFGGPFAYSEFGRFLSEQDIDFKSFSY